MEKLVWAGMALIMLSGGMFMTLLPGVAVLMNRDDGDDTSPPTAGEIFLMRLGGALLLLGGVFSLHAIVHGVQGAVDPVMF
jgi:hypothetical protein